MILSEGLIHFFNKFEYSLFSIELTAEQKEQKYQHVEQRDFDDCGFKRHLNDYCTSCLLVDNTALAKKFIELALKVDDENMHTWCNKGVFKLAKDEYEDAKEAAFRVLELMAEDTAACRLRAKIDFAYWKAEAVRTEDARDECYEILRKCLPEAIHIKEMQEYLSYSLLKLLVRQLRSDDKRNKPNCWLEEKLSSARDQLFVLYNSTKYKADFWLWLSDLYSVHLNEELLNEMLRLLSQRIGLTDINRELCINKAMKQASCKERKMSARIAKNCLDCAYHCDDEPNSCDPALQLHWFQKAVDLSERWIEENNWTFMCSSTAVQALLNIWGIEFYAKNEELVQRRHHYFYGKRIGKQSNDTV